MRESFVFYKSFYDAIKKVEESSQLKIYQAVMNFALYGEEPNLKKDIETIVFTLIKPQIIASNTKYAQGIKGGRPKKSEEKQNKELEVKNKEAKKHIDAGVETLLLDYEEFQCLHDYLRLEAQKIYQEHLPKGKEEAIKKTLEYCREVKNA